MKTQNDSNRFQPYNSTSTRTIKQNKIRYVSISFQQTFFIINFKYIIIFI